MATLFHGDDCFVSETSTSALSDVSINLSRRNEELGLHVSVRERRYDLRASTSPNVHVALSQNTFFRSGDLLANETITSAMFHVSIHLSHRNTGPEKVNLLLRELD